MKRFLSGLLALVLCLNLACAGASVDRYLGGVQTQQFVKNDSSNAAVSLVTGVTGQVVTLYKYTLSTATADTFYFRCGNSTAITGNAYLGANSGINDNLSPFVLQCASGQTLFLVKGTAGTAIGITGWYTIDF